MNYRIVIENENLNRPGSSNYTDRRSVDLIEACLNAMRLSLRNTCTYIEGADGTVIVKYVDGFEVDHSDVETD